MHLHMGFLCHKMQSLLASSWPLLDPLWWSSTFKFVCECISVHVSAGAYLACASLLLSSGTDVKYVNLCRCVCVYIRAMDGPYLSSYRLHHVVLWSLWDRNTAMSTASHPSYISRPQLWSLPHNRCLKLWSLSQSLFNSLGRCILTADRLLNGQLVPSSKPFICYTYISRSGPTFVLPSFSP